MQVIKTGKSRHGRDIELIKISNTPGGKNILIIGGFHGDEPQGVELLRDLTSQNLLSEPKNRILIIPCLNPDGLAKGTRTNASGVDLNRNFPASNWEEGEKNEFYSGESAGSEPETRFLTEILNETQFDCIVTLHAPFETVNFDGPAQFIAEKISELSGYPVQKDIGYPTPGSFGTFAGIERNIPTITLELSETETFDSLKNRTEKVFLYLFSTF